MKLARVTGTVVATRKEPDLEGLRLLVIKPCDPDGKPNAEPALVAADAMGAGLGELVLFAAGSSARLTAATRDRPVDAVIMAIVDLVESDGKQRYHKGQEAG